MFVLGPFKYKISSDHIKCHLKINRFLHIMEMPFLQS